MTLLCDVRTCREPASTLPRSGVEGDDQDFDVNLCERHMEQFSVDCEAERVFGGVTPADEDYALWTAKQEEQAP